MKAIAARGACKDAWLMRPLRQLVMLGNTADLVTVFTSACGLSAAYSRDVALLALATAHFDVEGMYCCGLPHLRTCPLPLHVYLVHGLGYPFILGCTLYRLP